MKLIAAVLHPEQKGMLPCVECHKDAVPGRFYAIRNCCSFGCGAMQAWQHGTPMLSSSVCVAAVDASLCAACSLCADYCQFAALTVDNGHAIVDNGACLVSPQQLHCIPLSSSTPIRCSPSSRLISRTAQRSSYLTFGPSQRIGA